jgi:hypothetical protein
LATNSMLKHVAAPTPRMKAFRNPERGRKLLIEESRGCLVHEPIKELPFDRAPLTAYTNFPEIEELLDSVTSWATPLQSAGYC